MATDRFGLVTDPTDARFGDRDRRTMDALLAAFEAHDHSGGDALTDPADPPVLTEVADAGANLPTDATLYYRFTYVDAHGLESNVSAEANIATPGRLARPARPTATQQLTGALLDGQHMYAVSYFVDGGGQTQASPAASVSVQRALGYGSVELELPALPAGADGWRIFRKGPRDNQLYELTDVLAANGTTWVDTGALAINPARSLPYGNTSASSKAVRVAQPAGAAPDAAVAWRIYRGGAAGVSDGLVAEVPIETLTYDDDGPLVSADVPPETATTLAPSALVPAVAVVANPLPTIGITNGQLGYRNGALWIFVDGAWEGPLGGGAPDVGTFDAVALGANYWMRAADSPVADGAQPATMPNAAGAQDFAVANWTYDADGFNDLPALHLATDTTAEFTVDAVEEGGRNVQTFIYAGHIPERGAIGSMYLLGYWGAGGELLDVQLDIDGPSTGIGVSASDDDWTFQNATAPGPTHVDGAPHVIVARRTAAELALWVDGVKVLTYATAPALGALTSVNSFFVRADFMGWLVGQFALFPAALTDEQIETASEQLCAEYGITYAGA